MHEICLAADAEFIVVDCGDVMTMHGPVVSADKIDIYIDVASLRRAILGTRQRHYQ